MSRRRIWLIIIGILIAGVSITWAVERFVSSRGVDTAAVVGFEADACRRGLWTREILMRQKTR